MKSGIENISTISAYIITKNEEHNIARAIESVRWMNEVVVLDSGSSDRTVAIAESLGAKVTIAEFRGFVEQKNAAMDLCSSDWLFNLDADEEITPELRKSIEEVVYSDRNSGRPDVYRVNRKTWYMGRWINHCGWYPEYRSRFSKRGHARWRGEVLHEQLLGDGPAGIFSGDMLHRPYRDLGEHMAKIGCYSELWANRETASGRTPSMMDLMLRPTGKFLKMYVLRAGFLDRGPGFVASFMGAWYTFMKYARLYEMSRNTK